MSLLKKKKTEVQVCGCDRAEDTSVLNGKCMTEKKTEFSVILVSNFHTINWMDCLQIDIYQ